jgi:parvulin-like peptidyl-prolyl isomerase
MQRSTALIYSVFFAGAVAFVVANGRPKGREVSAPAADAGAGVDAGSPADAEAAGDASYDGGEAPVGDGPEREVRTDAGATLLSGDAPPGLAAEAPKKVRFGVVLVQYRGAQGAPPTSRSRDAALTLAKELAEAAKTDFKAAVAKGDKGSNDDLGYIPRGILEPGPEYELFSLPKGGVSGPVDTPRGFWIVHRIE